MPALMNDQWIYSKRPEGIVGPEHYQLQHEQIRNDLSANEVLLAARYISVDPYMRIQQSANNTWDVPHPLGIVQRSSVVAQVLASNAPQLQKNDWVLAYSGWQRHAVVHASELQKLDPQTAPVTTALHVLGMPGRTAWFGLMDEGRPRPGETVVVSAAAGAVGSLVVQFAKRAGARVLGIVGSNDKASWLTQKLGADAALVYRDYKSAAALQKAITEKIGGVDVYFDNVGGWISDAVIAQINKRARIIICGQISQYSHLDTPETGPRFFHHVLYQRATIQGILARDYLHRVDEMLGIVSPWVTNGEIIYEETILDGFEQLPQALGQLFSGANTGKLIVKI